ncbi:MAG: glycosyltransferase family 39 protein [Flavobacteriales bacterium]|nr:glycosyltransferase family 39 protein [Flavobacteriales bacterium]
MERLYGPVRSGLWLLPIIGGLIWCWEVGYEGLNGQDAHDYLRTARAWEGYFLGGERPLTAEHPQAYPYAGAVLGAVLGNVLIAMRLLPILAFIVLGLVFRRAIEEREQVASPAWVYVLLAIGASPFLLRYALVCMSDLPAMALVVLSWWAWGRAIADRNARWWVLCSVAAVLAVQVRLACAPMLGGLVLLTAYRMTPERWSRIFLYTCGALLTLAVLPALFQPQAWMEEVAGTPLADWTPVNLFRRELHSDDGVLRYPFPNGVRLFAVFVHPGFLPLGAVLIVFARSSDLQGTLQRAAVAMLITYLLFVGSMPFQNDRVLLLAQPFAAFLLYPAFLRLWARVEAAPRYSTPVLVVVVALQVAFFVRAMAPFIRNARVEQELAAEVVASGTSHVYTHGMGAAFSNLCPRQRITELWYAPVPTFEPGALVVVKPMEMLDQWKGLHPATNWERAREQGLEVLDERPDGWGIYRVR